MTSCPHDRTGKGMCAACAQLKPYVIFRPDMGYVWGPASDKNGQPARWGK